MSITDDLEALGRMDGTMAYHNIDRDAATWADTGRLMEAWADARAKVKLAELEATIAELQRRPALDSETLLKAMNAISRQLIGENCDTSLDDIDGEDFHAGKLAGIVKLSAELIKHIHLASTTPTTPKRN